MSFKRFKKIQSDDRELNLIQDNIDSALRSIIANEALDSQIVAGVKLKAAATNKVAHSLGRILSGWIVVRKNASADVWDAQSLNASPDLLLWLHSSVDVTVDLLVF